MPILLKKEKQGIHMDFMSNEEVKSDMDELLATFGATKEQADTDKARKTLRRFGPVSEEMSRMRDENR